MRWKTFYDYMVWREGLWMSDNNAIEGLSKLPKPKPPTKASAVKPTFTPQVRPVKIVKPASGTIW